jgi:hypothetical protein
LLDLAVAGDNDDDGNHDGEDRANDQGVQNPINHRSLLLTSESLKIA